MDNLIFDIIRVNEFKENIKKINISHVIHIYKKIFSDEKKAIEKYGISYIEHIKKKYDLNFLNNLLNQYYYLNHHKQLKLYLDEIKDKNKNYDDKDIIKILNKFILLYKQHSIIKINKDNKKKNEKNILISLKENDKDSFFEFGQIFFNEDFDFSYHYNNFIIKDELNILYCLLCNENLPDKDIENHIFDIHKDKKFHIEYIKTIHIIDFLFKKLYNDENYTNEEIEIIDNNFKDFNIIYDHMTTKFKYDKIPGYDYDYYKCFCECCNRNVSYKNTIKHIFFDCDFYKRINIYKRPNYQMIYNKKYDINNLTFEDIEEIYNDFKKFIVNNKSKKKQKKHTNKFNEILKNLSYKNIIKFQEKYL